MARYDVISGATSTGIILNNDSMYVSNGGTANGTTVNECPVPLGLDCFV